MQSVQSISVNVNSNEQVINVYKYSNVPKSRQLSSSLMKKRIQIRIKTGNLHEENHFLVNPLSVILG